MLTRHFSSILLSLALLLGACADVNRPGASGAGGGSTDEDAGIDPPEEDAGPTMSMDDAGLPDLGECTGTADPCTSLIAPLCPLHDGCALDGSNICRGEPRACETFTREACAGQRGCVVVCGAGETRCGAECVQLASDSDHCGVCGRVCGAGTSCEASECRCDDPPGQESCGACGNFCSADESCVLGTCAGANEPTLLVVSRVVVPMVTDDERVTGFDLDGVVSDGLDAEGCGIVDRESLGGEPGIDNELAALTELLDPVLAPFGIDSLQDEVDSLVNSGSLLLGVRTTQASDGTLSIDLVNLRTETGGRPTLGPDGSIAAGGRFRVSGAPLATITDVPAGQQLYDLTGFDFRIPPIAGLGIPLALEDARIRVDVSPGRNDALVGGSFDPAPLLAFSDLIRLFLTQDIQMDGECIGVSGALDMTLVDGVLVQ